MSTDITNLTDSLDKISDGLSGNPDFIPMDKISTSIEQLKKFDIIKNLYRKYCSVENKCKRLLKHKTNQDKKHNEKYLSPNIPIEVKSLPTLNSLPDYPLYWIEDISQYAFMLNGVIFRGNVGNIVDNDKKVPHNIPCKYGQSCNLPREQCYFYHDPIIQKGCSTGKSDIYVRNFRPVNFVYNSSRKKKLECMTHIGNRDSLDIELTLLKHHIRNNKFRDEPKRYMDQTMHNILVCMAMKIREILY